MNGKMLLYHNFIQTCSNDPIIKLLTLYIPVFCAFQLILGIEKIEVERNK